MATAIQKNGMKPLTNGSMNRVEEINNMMVPIEAQNDAELVIDEDDDKPELDIIINNVVSSFSVRCHLNLREIALHGTNVEYRRENGMVRMKLRKPHTTASISSSGKVTCTGATSEDEAKKAARRFARQLQKLGFKVHFNNYRIVNVLGTCTMPWGIRIIQFSTHYKNVVDYEPELHPGVTYRLKHIKATVKIFSTGSITVTAPSVGAVQSAIEDVYPLVYEFRKERTREEQNALDQRKRRTVPVERLVTIRQMIINRSNVYTDDEGSVDSDASSA